MSEYGVALFYTTSSAMGAEKLLARAGLTVKLIPTPRQFSSDCGISLRFLWDKCRQIESLFEREQIEYETIRQL
jgi:hypothetical protein